jgi:hypothetical protein
MLVGKKEFGTWKDGSSIYKDSKGYYIVAFDPSAAPAKQLYKKYLKGWKPAKEPTLCVVNKRWTVCNKKKAKKHANIASTEFQTIRSS